jgi:hypothetical protein
MLKGFFRVGNVCFGIPEKLGELLFRDTIALLAADAERAHSPLSDMLVDERWTAAELLGDFGDQEELHDFDLLTSRQPGRVVSKRESAGAAAR